MGRRQVRVTAHHRGSAQEPVNRKSQRPLCRADACDAVADPLLCASCFTKLPGALQHRLFEAWVAARDGVGGSDWELEDALRVANGYLGRLR